MKSPDSKKLRVEAPSDAAVRRSLSKDLKEVKEEPRPVPSRHVVPVVKAATPTRAPQQLKPAAATPSKAPVQEKPPLAKMPAVVTPSPRQVATPSPTQPVTWADEADARAKGLPVPNATLLKSFA